MVKTPLVSRLGTQSAAPARSQFCEHLYLLHCSPDPLFYSLGVERAVTPDSELDVAPPLMVGWFAYSVLEPLKACSLTSKYQAVP